MTAQIAQVAQTDWIDIGALDAIPRRGARKVAAPGGCIAVFRTGADKVFAIDNACPHKGGPLSEGIVHGEAVSCPLHNLVISLETGAAQGLDGGSVRSYPVKVEEGRVLLCAPSLALQAAE